MPNDPSNAARADALAGKVMSPAEAVAVIQHGQKVFVGTGCATPRALVAALEARNPVPADVVLRHFLTNGAVPHVDGKPVTKFRHRSFFVGSDVRQATARGAAEYVPISLAQLPQLVVNGRYAPDAVFIQVSLPDAYGYCSMGVSVDVQAAMVQAGRTVVAEINPHMPRTPVFEQIARYIASIIDDGSGKACENVSVHTEDGTTEVIMLFDRG